MPFLSKPLQIFQIIWDFQIALQYWNILWCENTLLSSFSCFLKKTTAWTQRQWNSSDVAVVMIRLLYTRNTWPLGCNHCSFLLTCLTCFKHTSAGPAGTHLLAPWWKVVLLFWSVKVPSFPAHFSVIWSLTPGRTHSFQIRPKGKHVTRRKFSAYFRIPYF